MEPTREPIRRGREPLTVGGFRTYHLTYFISSSGHLYRFGEKVTALVIHKPQGERREEL